MARYITFPASAPNDLSQAKLHSSEELTGLTNGTSYIAHRLSEASEAFTPAALAGSTTLNAIVSNRGFWLQSTRNVGATGVMRRGRFMTTQGDVTNLRTVDAGWLVTLGDQVNPLPNSCTFGRFIEYPAGTRHPVTFGGAATGTLVNDGVLVSDVVLDVATGEPLLIPAGAVYWEVNTNPTGATQTYPVWTTESGVGYQMLVGGLPLDAYSTSVATHGTSTNATNNFSSIFVMGDVLAAEAKSAVMCGDSLTTGWGDIQAASARGEKGLARIPDALGWGYFSGSSRGGNPARYITNLAPRLATVLAACGAEPSHGIIQTGINSFGTDSASAILAAREGVRSALTAMVSDIRFIDTTITPSTNLEDGWVSEESQIIVGGNNRRLAVKDFNDGIRARGSAGTSVVWDLANITMLTPDSGTWKALYPALPNDGLHIRSEGQADIAAQIAAAPGL